MGALVIGNQEEAVDRKFKPGDVANIRGQRGVPVTILGYVQDPRTGEERAVVYWLDKDSHPIEAALPEDVLVLATPNVENLRGTPLFDPKMVGGIQEDDS